MHIDLVIERLSTNKLSKADEQRKEIAVSADKRSSTPGVTGKATSLIGPVEVEIRPGVKQWRYGFKVRLTKENFRTEAAATRCLETARKFVMKAAEGRGWTVRGDAQEIAEQKAAAEARPPFVVPELDSEVQETYFSHVKEREAHMRLIHSSMATHALTQGEERNHVLLYGEPAAAKSSLIQSFKNWFDDIDGIERVMQINATTLSKAGLEKLLLEKSQDGLLPEILWINELEKGNPEDFLCLLAVMDGMGKIQRLNSRIGKQEAKCNVLVIADCNDGEKIKGWNKGALWSRFSNRLPCVRPSRELMEKILKDAISEREAKGYPANYAWVKPAIDSAFDVAKDNDPRFVKSLLAHGDRLLDGSYRRDIEEIQKAYLISQAAKS